jgi:hypothetical protein
LVDEGQDLNARLAQIVQDQIGHSQVVVVGDQFQQIYEWMGSVDALAKFNFPSKAHLTTSFRFGPPIAEVANLILAELGCTLKVTGSSIPSAIGSLEKPVAILTRTNATGISQLLSAQEVGKRAHLIGGGADVIAFAEAARDLQAGIGTQHPDLACFDSWQDVKHYVGEDGEEGGADLRLLVKIVDTYGPEKIITALRHQPEEKAAELVISTAHKAKGRTFDTVQMAGDFPADRKFDPEADDKRPVTAEDLRLFYVGCTRARYQLDIDALPGLKEAYGRIAGAAAVDEGALRDQAGPVLDVDRNADEDGLRPDHRRAEPTSGSEAVCTSTDLHADTGTDPSRTGDQPSLREPELRQPEAPGSGDAQREHAGDVPQRRRTARSKNGVRRVRKAIRQEGLQGTPGVLNVQESGGQAIQSQEASGRMESQSAPLGTSPKPIAVPQPLITWRKARDGQWAVYGPASALREGEWVTVTRKDGQTRRAHIEAVSKSFPGEGDVPYAFGYVDRGEGR